MKIRRYQTSLTAALILVGALFLAGSVAADPVGMQQLGAGYSAKLASGFLASSERSNIKETWTFTPQLRWGNDDMHQRYYSPILGRFISVDPVIGRVGGSQSWNRYTYALNSPLGVIDPDGRGNFGVLSQQAILGPMAAKQRTNFLKSQKTAELVAAAGWAAAFVAIFGGAAAVEALPVVQTQVLNGNAQRALEFTEEVANPGPGSVSPSSFTRGLTQADLGINGAIDELKGSISMNDGNMRVAVDMISGQIDNPLQVMGNLVEGAKKAGATTLEITGTLANERLLKILEKRYGAVTEGGVDLIRISLDSE